MNRFAVIFTVFTLFAMAPALVDAQSANRALAERTLQSNFPPGVSVQNASIDQISAAVRRMSATLNDADFAELSGDISYLVAEAQPAIAAQTSAAIVQSAAPGYVAGISVSVAANAAAATAGRPGASSATQIARQVREAATPRGGVPPQALAQAIVNSTPSAAAEISDSMNVRVTVPASPIAPPSGLAAVSSPGGPVSPGPVVNVPPPGPVPDDAPDPIIEAPTDPEVPSNGSGSGSAGSGATTAGSGGVGTGAVATGAAVLGGAIIVGAIVSSDDNGNGDTTATNP